MQKCFITGPGDTCLTVFLPTKFQLSKNVLFLSSIYFVFYTSNQTNIYILINSKVEGQETNNITKTSLLASGAITFMFVWFFSSSSLIGSEISPGFHTQKHLKLYRFMH